MIYLVTGMPGNGKTLFAVDFIVKAVKAGREVYSDIEGLQIPEVKPAPDDWRTLPDGALIVYDEAHRRFPAYKGKGRSPLEVVREMDTHRHRGFDMMMITQWPDKIDGELFRLVGKHQHLNRAMGLQRASLVTFSRGTANPYSASARKGADEEIWEYPKHLYTSYKSSSLHTDAHKFKLPAKVKAGLATIPVIVLVLWAFYKFFLIPDAPASERSEAEPTAHAQRVEQLYAPPVSTGTNAAALAQGTGAYLAISTEPAPTLAGCVSSDRGCRCFNTDGFQIDMSQHQCQDVLSKPMPFNVYHPYRTGSSAAPAASQAAPATGAGVVIGGESGAFPEAPPSALRGG